MEFNEFQEMNRQRSVIGFGVDVAYDNPVWPLQNWMLAIAGEAGEACNKVKKSLLGDCAVQEMRTDILYELADIITYCDLAMSSLGADTGAVLLEKFDIVSKRIGWERA